MCGWYVYFNIYHLKGVLNNVSTNTRLNKTFVFYKFEITPLHLFNISGTTSIVVHIASKMYGYEVDF